eukprot:418260-Prorocentrum_minimum.AAC.4
MCLLGRPGQSEPLVRGACGGDHRSRARGRGEGSGAAPLARLLPPPHPLALGQSAGGYPQHGARLHELISRTRMKDM